MNVLSVFMCVEHSSCLSTVLAFLVCFRVEPTVLGSLASENLSLLTLSLPVGLAIGHCLVLLRDLCMNFQKHVLLK